MVAQCYCCNNTYLVGGCFLFDARLVLSAYCFCVCRCWRVASKRRLESDRFRPACITGSRWSHSLERPPLAAQRAVWFACGDSMRPINRSLFSNLFALFSSLSSLFAPAESDCFAPFRKATRTTRRLQLATCCAAAYAVESNRNLQVSNHVNHLPIVCELIVCTRTGESVYT